MRGEIIGQKGDVLTVKLFDELDIKEVKKQAVDGRYYVYVDVFEKDSITDLQRKHIFALMGDYTEYTGYPLNVSEDYRKFRFMKEEGMDELPSLKVNQMKKSVASRFIEYMILEFLEHGIPFRKNKWYLSTESSNLLFALTMKGLCLNCGKPHSDLHHAKNLVGMGRKRNKHKHEDSEYLRLCRACHQEAHSMGLDEFLNKHVLKTVKLSRNNLIELGVINKKENENGYK